MLDFYAFSFFFYVPVVSCVDCKVMNILRVLKVNMIHVFLPLIFLSAHAHLFAFIILYQLYTAQKLELKKKKKKTNMMWPSQNFLLYIGTAK